jgi:glutamate racemase
VKAVPSPVAAKSAQTEYCGGVDAPLGIFDSGVGGLTVARAVLDQLPAEKVVYVGDTAHNPYGPRRIADVRSLALDVMDALVSEHRVKLLIIACNSASAACLRDARERYDIGVVEVIQPAVRRAVAATRNGKIGVIGTQSTISSRAYDDAFAAAPHVELTTVSCPDFVAYVEAGDTNSPQLLEAAKRYLAPIVHAGCDTLVLGCTHYPLLTGVISYVVGDGVTLVSSAEETAKDVYRELARTHGFRDENLPPPEHRFLATGDPEPFERLGRRFLGPEVAAVARATRTPATADRAEKSA